jgi:peroxiredoxin
VVAIGQPIPQARVQKGPGDETTLAELHADGPLLLVFYLFDWSST